jgi:hypothetical protein
MTLTELCRTRPAREQLSSVIRTWALRSVAHGHGQGADVIVVAMGNGDGIQILIVQ